eukprot:UN02056
MINFTFSFYLIMKLNLNHFVQMQQNLVNLYLLITQLHDQNHINEYILQYFHMQHSTLILELITQHHYYVNITSSLKYVLLNSCFVLYQVIVLINHLQGSLVDLIFVLIYVLHSYL